MNGIYGKNTGTVLNSSNYGYIEWYFGRKKESVFNSSTRIIRRYRN